MCARAAEVSAPVPARCKHRFVRTEAVKGAVFHVESNHADTLAILHDEIECKIFDEKVGVVTQRLAIKSVQQCVTSAVRCSSAAVRLSTFAVLERLTTESALINFSFLGTRKWYAKVLELLGKCYDYTFGEDDVSLTSITVLGASRVI